MALFAADLATLSRLFDEAQTLAPDALERWLAALPAAQAPLLGPLREMLAAHARGETATGHAFFAAGPGLAPEADPTQARAGEAIGPYRLVRELGQGGMGTVWLAERADGGLKRPVALKLPRLAWGTGLGERMARERDVGAMLEHPHIARLYDAGVDALGRPYLAFEFVDGQAIDGWCEARGLPVRERLVLFLQVAQAVAYAHGRLVVHRDLKPSNVLVTPDGQARLLDFGIAKLLDDELPADSPLTRDRGHVLTPRYASPEQRAGQAVTVRSDVYSLGVLLHELLTGALPFAPGRLGETGDTGDDPPPASTRTPDPARARQLRGELDAILGKALRHDPERRYPTADAFAEDVRRHLAGELVEAQPDSVGYRWRKFARRHWVGLAAVATVCVAIVGGSAVAVVQAQRATRAAERERVVREFVAEVFRANGRDDGGAGAGAGATADRQPFAFVENGAKLVETRFQGQPDLQADLFGMVGEVFSDMGAYGLAADYRAKQADALARGGAGRAAQGRALLAAAQAMSDEGRGEDAERRLQGVFALAGGEPALEEAGHVLQLRILTERSDWKAVDQQLQAPWAQHVLAATRPGAAQAWLLESRAGLAHHRGAQDEALATFERAIATAVAAEGPSSVLAADVRIASASAMAGWRAFATRTREILDTAVATLRQRGGAHEVRAARMHAKLVARDYVVLQDQVAGDIEATLQRDRRVLAATSLRLPPWFLPEADFWIGACRAAGGRVTDGLALMTPNAEALRAASRLPHEIVQGDIALANALDSAGRHDEAKPLWEEMIRVKGATSRSGVDQDVWDYGNLVWNRLMAGRLDEAEQAMQASFRITGGYDPQQSAWTVASLRLAQGRPAEALRSSEAVVQTSPPAPSDYGVVEAATDINVAEIFCMLEAPRAREGLQRLERALALNATKFYPDAPWDARAHAVAGRCALLLGDRARAEAHADAARGAFERQPQVSAYFTIPYDALRRALGERGPRATSRVAQGPDRDNPVSFD